MNEPTPRPYSGVRVIDLAQQLGSYCSRLFADLGADVIRIEPSGGAPDRHLASPVAFEFLNINKRSVVLDTGSESGRAVLRDLIASAAIVVWQPGGAIDLPAILAVPGARVVTVISHFGLTGPYAHFLGCDLVDQALGGIAFLSGEAGKPPLRLAGEQSLFVASLYAAAATALALWHCESSGQGHMLDVSAQEAIAHSLQNAPQGWDLEGRITTRGGEGTRDATEDAFRCQDGYVFLAATLALSASWSGLLGWMRDEGFDGLETLLRPEWNDRQARMTEPMKRQFRALFERFVATRSTASFAAEALRRKIVMAPVSRIADLPQDPQLAFRRYFQRLPMPALHRDVVVPGAPYRLSEPVWRLDRAAPGLGADNAQVLGGG